MIELLLKHQLEDFAPNNESFDTKAVLADPKWQARIHKYAHKNPKDFWDPLKCIGLGRPFWYVSFGAELRGSYEVYRNYNWGSGPQDRNGYYLNRLISHGDFHFGPSARTLRNSRVVLSSVAMGAPGPRSMRTNLTSTNCFSNCDRQRNSTKFQSRSASAAKTLTTVTAALFRYAI
jgi:hypothetical protein